MSKNKSIFYKERDWNDFHFYNGSILNEIKIIESPTFYTYRKNIKTIYHKNYYERLIPSIERNEGYSFVHDKINNIEFGVINGFYQYTNAYNLISCLNGKIYLVVLDDRNFSNTKNKWESFVITPENNLQIFIPQNFLLGYYSMEKNSIILEKLAYKESEECVNKLNKNIFNYKSVGITWPNNSVII